MNDDQLTQALRRAFEERSQSIQAALGGEQCVPVWRFDQDSRGKWDEKAIDHVRACPVCSRGLMLAWRNECPSIAELKQYLTAEQYPFKNSLSAHLSEECQRCALAIRSIEAHSEILAIESFRIDSDDGVLPWSKVDGPHRRLHLFVKDGVVFARVNFSPDATTKTNIEIRLHGHKKERVLNVQLHAEGGGVQRTAELGRLNDVREEFGSELVAMITAQRHVPARSEGTVQRFRRAWVPAVLAASVVIGGVFFLQNRAVHRQELEAELIAMVDSKIGIEMSGPDTVEQPYRFPLRIASVGSGVCKIEKITADSVLLGTRYSIVRKDEAQSIGTAVVISTSPTVTAQCQVEATSVQLEAIVYPSELFTQRERLLGAGELKKEIRSLIDSGREEEARTRVREFEARTRKQ